MSIRLSRPSVRPSRARDLAAPRAPAWWSFAAAMLLAVGATAQFPATESDELAPAMGHFAGRAVALHGDVLFLGVPGDQFTGTPRFVHAYRLVGGQWTLEQTLVPDALDDGRFGFALDFDGTTLVVGSPALLPDGHGRATVYTHDGASWVGSALPHPTGEPLVSYSSSVAVDGSSILVGASLADVPIPGQLGDGVGAAYGYRRTAAGTWAIKQQVLPSSPVNQLGFGAAVDISGDHALIGTGDDRVHAFHFALGTQWSEVQVLTPSLASPDSGFGLALSMSGDRAVIGAWMDKSFAEDGAAFVFERACGQWTELQRLAAPVDQGTYARAVGISGDVVLVGAPSLDQPRAKFAGGAYAYRWDGATFGLEQELHAALPAENGQLGFSLALSGDRALLGAPGASVLPGGSGFVFDAVAVTSPWTNLGFSLAGTTAPELHGTGTLQPGSPVELALGCGPAGAPGVLFVGLAEILAPFKGGVLVPQPQLVVALLLDGSGGLSLQATWPTTLPSGTTVSLQAWLPDAGGPAGLAASNGLRASPP